MWAEAERITGPERPKWVNRSSPNSSNTCHVGAFLEIHHDIEFHEWNEQHCIHVIKLGICLCKLSLN